VRITVLSLLLFSPPSFASELLSLEALLDDTATPEEVIAPRALWPTGASIDQIDRTVTLHWADQPAEILPFAAILQIEHARAWDGDPEELFVVFNDGRRVVLARGPGVVEPVKLMKVWLGHVMTEMPVGEGHMGPSKEEQPNPVLKLTAAGGAIKLGGFSQTSSTLATKTPAKTCTDCIQKTDLDLVVKTRMDKLRECYRRELRNHPTLIGTITVKFVVNRNGGIGSAVVKNSSIQNEAVEQCILEEFLKMRFPRPSGNQEITATYPLTFGSG
jgi:hypothetical protein